MTNERSTNSRTKAMAAPAVLFTYTSRNTPRLLHDFGRNSACNLSGLIDLMFGFPGFDATPGGLESMARNKR